MRPTWTYRPSDPELEQTLRRGLSVTPLAARVLGHRGVQNLAEAERFLAAETADLTGPDAFEQMPIATERIRRAIARQEPILVYGDYDVDGLTGSCLLGHVLKALGAQVDVYVPDRLTEGYGLNPTGMNAILAMHPGLVITVDHGVTAFDQVQTLTASGIDVIVTDHHQKPPVLPDALALLNPLFLPDNSPARHLSGAGVAFKLACALFLESSPDVRRSKTLRDTLHDGMALAALGTVADLVPLVEENRILVKHGLSRLTECKLPGLAALTRQAMNAAKPMDAEQIAFGFAPRLNAAGRMGKVQVAKQLLLSLNRDESQRLAQELEQLNLNRRELQHGVAAKALAMAEDQAQDCRVLVLADSEFHPGVMGIVAAKLVDRYHKPAFVISVGDRVARGSGRSIGGFNLAAALAECGHLLNSHGGHAAAAGLEIAPENIDAFRSAMQDHIEQIGLLETSKRLEIDSEIQLHQVTYSLMKELESFGPYGQGNPKPVFAVSGVDHAEPPRRVGEEGAHLLMKLRYPTRPITAIAFQQGHRVNEVKNGGLSLAFSLSESRFRGTSACQLLVEDFRVDDE